MAHADLIKKITCRDAIVGVIGLGYVGLPLALAFAKKNFSVIGFDVDENKVKSINAGRSYMSHLSHGLIHEHTKKGNFSATADFTRLSVVDAVLICVPTPLNDQKEPDLSYVISTSDAIVPQLMPEQLIILESTTYPGCTEQVLKPRLEKSGLRSGKDFFLAYSPEREDPGNSEFDTASIPKVVGGDGPQALEAALALYNEIVLETIPVSSISVAEAVKLTENVFRSVNIALVNELKTVYQKIGLNIWEVIHAAKTKPFGYMPFYPGPGLGGHCIPIDPFYLSWCAKQVGEATRFIELAGEINTEMPSKIVKILENTLKDKHNKAMTGADILLMGVAYKKNVGDTRESPAFALMELMEAEGASVAFHDPFGPEIPITRGHKRLAGRSSVDLSTEKIEKYDAIVICTDHDAIDYRNLASRNKLIIDTRNAVAGLDFDSYNGVVVRA